MARTEVRTGQIADANVTRDDLNTVDSGKAVVRKIVQGTGVTISSTGADSGTGDVTINADAGGAPGIALNAAEALEAGELVNIFNDAGTIKARLADAGSERQADGFVLAAVAINDPATIYSTGLNDELAGLTGGAEHYLSAVTPGAATATAPTASGHLVQRVGKAISATELDFKKGVVFKRG
jgi:hypothetical protein